VILDMFKKGNSLDLTVLRPAALFNGEKQVATLEKAYIFDSPTIINQITIGSRDNAALVISHRVTGYFSIGFGLGELLDDISHSDDTSPINLFGIANRDTRVLVTKIIVKQLFTSFDNTTRRSENILKFIGYGPIIDDPLRRILRDAAREIPAEGNPCASN